MKKKKTKNKLIFKIMLGVILLVIVYSTTATIYNALKKDVISSDVSLKKIVEITELSTVQYDYNAIATKYTGKDKKKENIEYYVAYEGQVTAGINANDVKINVNKKKKIVQVTLPKIEIQKIDININSLEYIFMKNQKESEAISQEAYQLCKKDLKKRIKEESTLYDIGKENAITIVEGLLGPWIESTNKDYKIVIK